MHIGLYFWLRLKLFFKWAAPFLLAIAVLLPPLAMTGAHRGGHEVTERALQAQWRNEHIKTTPLAQRAMIEDITLFYFPIFYLSAIVLVFVARGARTLLEARRGTITVSYPTGGWRAQGPEHSRSQPAIQCSARERVRRQGAVLDLPRPRRSRPQHAAAAVRPRSVRACARWRCRQPGDPARLPTSPAGRCSGHSSAPRQYRRGFRPQSQARQYRSGALYRQHVRRHASDRPG